MRSGSLRCVRAGTTEWISIPSRAMVASTLRMSPTLAPSGRTDDSTTPRGSRAPAARHVHVPSGRALVSSTSIRLGMGTETYRPGVRRARRLSVTGTAPRADATPPRYRRLVPIYALGDDTPEIHPDAFVHPDAVVIGAVRIGAESTIWPNAVLRGDGGGRIEIGAQTSVQDCSVLHTTPEHPTVVGDGCTVGHIVHLEGCTIEDGVLIGSGSVVLHGVVVHRGAIVGRQRRPARRHRRPGRRARRRHAGHHQARTGPARGDRRAGREVYVAKGREYREGLRRIG